MSVYFDVILHYIDDVVWLMQRHPDHGKLVPLVAKYYCS